MQEVRGKEEDWSRKDFLEGFSKLMSELSVSNLRVELSNWISNYLDVPSPFYNGMKPCPWASAAWEADRVGIRVGTIKDVHEAVIGWDGSKEIEIVALGSGWETLEAYCEGLNRSHASLYLMAHLPGGEISDPSLDAEEWGEVIEEPYAVVFIQDLCDLNRKSRMLANTNYYDRCSSDFLKYVSQRQEVEASRARIQEGNG